MRRLQPCGQVCFYQQQPARKTKCALSLPASLDKTQVILPGAQSWNAPDKNDQNQGESS